MEAKVSDNVFNIIQLNYSSGHYITYNGGAQCNENENITKLGAEFVLATLKELQLATLNVLLPFVCIL
jgi:hypothetical protein